MGDKRFQALGSRTRRKVGLLGATGVVGQRFVQLLQQHPWFQLHVVAASSRSASKLYEDAVNWRLDSPMPSSARKMRVVGLDSKLLKECDIVFSALDAGPASEVELVRRTGVCICFSSLSGFCAVGHQCIL